MNRLSALFGLATAVLLIALPALAQESGGNVTPAVQLEAPAAQPALADWTYRYVIPTGLALAAIVILFTSIRYFTNVVRKRYRVVEE